MDKKTIKKMKNLLERIQITKKNEKEINLVKSYIEDSDYDAALELLKDLNSKGKLSIKEEYENIEVRNIEEDQYNQYGEEEQNYNNEEEHYQYYEDQENNYEENNINQITNENNPG